MAIPRLKLLAAPTLLALTYRALAADNDQDAAALNQRQLELVQARSTEILQAVSSLKMDVQIHEARALELAHDARQAELDLQIFEQQAPPPPATGMFKARPTAEQRAAQARRSELAGIAAAVGAAAAAKKTETAAARRELEQLTAEQAAVKARRGELAAELHEQLAGWVLGLVAAGDVAAARRVVTDARVLLRGDLMVATLLVLVELFTDGTADALAMLGELKPAFRQHDDPLPRVLGALIGLCHQGELSRREVGEFSATAFSTPAFNRLYQLVRVLGGWSFDEESLAADPFAATLWALREHIFGELRPADWTPQPAAQLAAWAAGNDPVVRTIAANTLLIRDATAEIPAAIGIDFAAIKPPQRKRETWPALFDLLGGPPPAWPTAAVAQWQALAACHVLYAAREAAPPALVDAWLRESYNWPKGDMYWWTLAALNSDDGLLNNISRDPRQLVTVPL